MRQRLDPADRRILGLAVPALGALAVEPLYTLTDTAVVGRLGREPLGGLAVAIAVLNVAVYACGFLAQATTSRVAYRRGARDAVGAARAAVAAYAVAAALGGVLAIGVGAGARPLAAALGASGGVLDAATTYLRWSAPGLPFMLLVLAGNGHHRGLADTRTPLRIAVATNAANAVLGVVFVHGFSWGVAGSALSTTLVQVAGGLWFAARSARAVAAAGAVWRPDPADVRGLMRDGAVIVVRTAALLAALTSATSLATRLGDDVLGGHQIGMNVFFLMALSLDALAIPAQTFVGEALGASDPAALRHLAGRCLRWSAGTGAVLGLVAVAASPVLPRLFVEDPDVRRAATVAVAMCGLAQPAAGLAFALDGVFLGAGRYATLRSAMLLALVPFAAVAAVPLALRPAGPAGAAAVWAALAVWLASRALLLARRYPALVGGA